MAMHVVGALGNLAEQNTNSYILYGQITWIIFLYISISILNVQTILVWILLISPPPKEGVLCSHAQNVLAKCLCIAVSPRNVFLMELHVLCPVALKDSPPTIFPAWSCLILEV